jgi:benzoyl-CoA reductase/2-hydroxyglutaryl-CoA dehydratase subunit BcrC/BadD/HgdB
MNKAYKEYFDTLGFAPVEVEKELPRIKKAFAKLGVTTEDLAICRKRLSEALDLSLAGARKCLQVFFNETVNLVLAGEEHEKVIYTTLPGGGGMFVAPLMVGHPEVYAQCVDMLTVVSLHPLFNKQVRCLEAGERYLPAGNVHCGGFRTLLGAMDLGIFAKPDLMVSWGVYCDEGPKASALIAEMNKVPIIYIDEYQDFPSDEPLKIPLPRYLEFVAGEMRKALKDIEKVLGYDVPDDMLMQAMMELAPIQSDYGTIQQLMLECDPVPLGMPDCMYAFALSAISCTPQDQILRLEALKTLREEVEQRAKRGEGPVKKGSPRILETVPSFSDPTSNHIFQECGLQVVGTDMAMYPPEGAGVPDLTGCYDFHTFIAKAIMATPASAGIAVRKLVMSAIVKKYKLDGVVLDVTYTCRVGAADSQIMKNFIEKELGIPALIMEHDVYDPRFFTPGQVRTRIETFAEQVRVYQESKKVRSK